MRSLFQKADSQKESFQSSCTAKEMVLAGVMVWAKDYYMNSQIHEGEHKPTCSDGPEQRRFDGANIQDCGVTGKGW